MSTVQQLDVFSCPLDGINQIEASAGTGKTWNICGLYLRLLLEREMTVQQILVVTFTNSATAELRERIRSRIAQTLGFLRRGAAPAGDPFVPTLVECMRDTAGLADDRMIALLDLALQTFDEASIFTIHGFCQRSMADTPFAAGMPLENELVKDDSEHLMEVVNDFWRQHVAGDALPPNLAHYMHGRGDTPESFAALLKRSLSKPCAIYAWPQETGAGQNGDGAAVAKAYADARALWSDADERASILDTAIKGLSQLNGNSYSREKIEAAAIGWTEFFKMDDAFARLPEDAKLDLLGTPTLAKRTKSKCVTPIHAFFDRAGDYLEARATFDASQAAARMDLLRRFLDTAAGTLRERKRARRIVSYDDILYNLYAALRDPAYPWLATSLQQRFPAALIDEFQDTDPLQFSIFQTIYQGSDAPLFFVGDPKQSIYSFRGADLHSYLKAQEITTARYSLAHNQRSTEGLIKAQNAIFSSNSRAFMLDGLAYTEVHKGDKPRKTFTDEGAQRADLQVWMLPDIDSEPILYGQAKAAAVQATAAEIARLIRDGAAGRARIGDAPLRPGDIAVLVRSHAQGSAVRNALAELRIGSVELSQESVYASTDAEEIARILEAIAQPARMGQVLAALATEIMGCEAADVDAIAADESRLMPYIERFLQYREMWMTRGFAFMYRRFIQGEGVLTRLLARADGERRMTNLLHLGELLHQAAEQHDLPATLLHWFATQRSEGAADDAAQLRLESDQNLVQIVTVHSSKGLEYPVVFCPFMWTGGSLAKGASLEGLVYHDDEGGTVIDFNDDAAHVKAVKDKIRIEQSAEELRLGYVALTRAVYRCYLVAGCYLKPGKTPSPTESTRSLLNWLICGENLSPADWFGHKMDVATIRGKWQALAAACPGHIAIAGLPMERGEPVAPGTVDAALLRARTLAAPPRQGWRMSSFSGLLHDAVGDAAVGDAAAGDAAATDHDARAIDVPLLAPGSTDGIAPDDILAFPRGASPGDCMHAVFEQIDFTDRSTWDEAIRQALAGHPQKLANVADEEQLPRLSRMLANMLDDVLQTEIAPGILLSRVPLAKRRTELAFHMPARQVGPERLNAFLEQAGYRCPRLAFGELDGYLNGFIDLVFECGGKYYVLDWKSNHMGYRMEGYGPRQLAAPMERNGYHLQYLIYTVALHRYLGLRVPGYSYDKHFGGALYLFVRGVRPGWRTPEGEPCGVYFNRPPAQVIEQLDRMLAPHAETIAG